MKKVRNYKFKKVSMSFVCPLCACPREIPHAPRPSMRFYTSFVVSSLVLGGLSYLVGINPFTGLFLPLFIMPFAWMMFKMRFRNALPCPQCGFDALWYKRNLDVARLKVQKHLEQEAKNELRH